MESTSSSEPTSFGILLRRHRVAAGISQEQLAERAGLSRRGIADLERGVRRLPYPDTVRRLSDALQLEPRDRTDFLVSVSRARRSAADLNGLAPTQMHGPDSRGAAIQERPDSAHPEAESALPSGTVTFLLTDVENSTRAWLRDPEAMSVALARHDALVERLVAEHNGRVVRPRGEGDSRFAVFVRPSDAVLAGCAIQVALVEEPWQLVEPLRVHMAIHTGETDLRLGDYYGPAINHCARLRGVAHGGQVLVSAVTADLVREALIPALALRDLGLHQLKDLDSAERVWQLVHARLPSDFPPLGSVPTTLHNLPILLSSFVGRDQAVAELDGMLATTRLLTLTGPGGIGKTRLALRVAFDSLADYPDGVWLVRLDALADPVLVTGAVASVLRVREQPGRGLREALADALSARHLLLVLDNCEHVLDACAELAEALLIGCPGLQILATSRERLGVPGEFVWPVPPLSLPSPEPPTASQALSQYEAVRLFAERAVAARPGFAVTNHNAEAVVRVCRRLDGLPLALELAAARMNALSVEQLAQRLDDRFRLLTGGSRTALPRQQTLRAAIDWSYDLLSEPERVLLRRLAVFAGGCSLEAAEAVCADDDIQANTVLNLLAGLVDKSLVGMAEQDNVSRYSLLETVRQYGQQKVREAGEEAALQQRHAEWCLALVEEAAAHLDGADQAEWLARLGIEYDNVRAALAWCATQSVAGSAMGLRFLDVLGHVWFKQQQQTEGRRWIERILRVGTGQPGPLRVRALNWGAEFAMHQGDMQCSDEFAEEGLRISRELGYTAGEGVALTRLGTNADNRGLHERAVVLLEAALRISLEASDEFGIWYARNNLAETFRHNGKLDPSTRLIEENLALATRRGDGWGLAQAVRQLGLVAEAKQEYARAADLLEECLALFQAIGAARGRHWALLELGRVELALGNPKRARELMGDSLRLCRDAWNVREIARCLEGLASVAAITGCAARAASLFGAAVAVRELTGLPPFHSDRTAYARGLEAVHDQLDDAAFASAWEEGHAMPLEQAITQAEDIVRSTASLYRQATPDAAESDGSRTSRKRVTGRLTARQSEVLHLVAEGKTDRQIAAQLVLSEKTVGRHLDNIFTRLGVSSRTAATVIAVRQGIA